jgi:NAD(P)-dependent dehydrogenase (short-subunit alcohol dehydrogenase family)
MRHVLITGGSGGIGQRASLYFAKNGWQVYSCDIVPIKPYHENITPLYMDVRIAKSVQTARTLIEARTKHLDAVIHLAGIYIMDSLVEVEEKDLINIFDINVHGVYRVNKEFLPLLKNGGRIIIITSELSCLDPLPFNGIYSITKKNLEAYAHSLRLELALIGIPVITVRPGAVNTGMLKDSFSSMEKMCRKTRLYQTNTLKFRTIMEKASGKPMPAEKLAKILFQITNTRHPRATYTLGAALLLRLFSALPAKIQSALLKKLLR